jgi:alpha-L-fucosidase 2
MVFGRPGAERIQLNEETLWAGGHVDRTNPEARDHLDEVRELLLDGDHAEAEAIAREHLLGDPERIRPYQTLGDLGIKMDSTAGDDSGSGRVPADYRRWLDLRDGLAGVEYRTDGAMIHRECFVSHADDVIALRIEADEPLSLRIGIDRPQDARSETDGDDRLRLRGAVVDFPEAKTGSGGWGVRFEAQVRVHAEGGTTRTSAGERTAAYPSAEYGVDATRPDIRVEDAKAVTVLLTAATTFEDDDPAARCDAILDNLADRSYPALRDRHVDAHRPKMDRVRIDLGSAPDAQTDERIAAFRSGNDASTDGAAESTGETSLSTLAADPDIGALAFQYGRYLLLASSQPGGFPANLQGIWNADCYPPWNADFHLNINLQMNYWPAEVGNLAECVDPLEAFVDDLRETGSAVAREHYDCAGFTAHHVSDAWGTATPADGTQGIWPLGAAWCCQHLYERYRYDRDPETLARIYPVMKDAARFLLDFLVEDDAGRLVTVPSNSPENHFVTPEDDEAQLCVMPTMDRFIARELFANTRSAAATLNRDPLLREELTTAIDRLPDPSIGEHGQMQEWLYDYEEVEPGHRHMSHLYGFHPGEEIHLRDDPDLAGAVRESIERRLDHGGGQCGWTRAWLMNIAARLENGAGVADHFAAYLEAYALPNGFNSAHEKTQIDGSFGVAAGVAEALLGSHGGELRLLPALPDAWDEGAVSGLRARGGFEVDIEWSEGTLDRATIRSNAGERCRVRTFGVDIKRIERSDGTAVDIQRPDDGVLVFDTAVDEEFHVRARQ